MDTNWGCASKVIILQRITGSSVKPERIYIQTRKLSTNPLETSKRHTVTHIYNHSRAPAH